MTTPEITYNTINISRLKRKLTIVTNNKLVHMREDLSPRPRTPITPPPQIMSAPVVSPQPKTPITPSPEIMSAPPPDNFTGAGVLVCECYKGTPAVVLARDINTGDYSEFGGNRNGSETAFKTAQRELIEESKMVISIRNAELEKAKWINHHNYICFIAGVNNVSNTVFTSREISKMISKMPYGNQKDFLETDELAHVSVDELYRMVDSVIPGSKGPFYVKDLYNRQLQILPRLKGVIGHDFGGERNIRRIANKACNRHVSDKLNNGASVAFLNGSAIEHIFTHVDL